jgi:hypothetical protein
MKVPWKATYVVTHVEGEFGDLVCRLLDDLRRGMTVTLSPGGALPRNSRTTAFRIDPNIILVAGELRADESSWWAQRDKRIDDGSFDETFDKVFQDCLDALDEGSICILKSPFLAFPPIRKHVTVKRQPRVA